MKTAILSDIHGNWDGFNTVLADIKSRQVDRIICLGDVVDGGEENDAVVNWLKANNITTVRGNHDENQGASRFCRGVGGACAQRIAFRLSIPAYNQ
jgi:predicted phosphodiesterase